MSGGDVQGRVAAVGRSLSARARRAIGDVRHGRGDDAVGGPLLHENESYPGYDDDDVERLELLRGPRDAPPKAGFVTDFIGVATAVDMLPVAENLHGTVVAALPVPHDSVHAEAAEYVALALAFELSDGDRFQLVELGAGWAPWMVNAGTVATRRGVTDVRLLGVEADAQHLEFARRHLVNNGLRQPSDGLVAQHGAVRSELIPAAIWWEDTELQFPSDGAAMDYGMAAQEVDSDADYRGSELTHVTVPAVSLARLLDGHGTVDLVHIDIQGSEATVVEKSLEALTARVRVMCIGTHSRAIEGALLATLHAAGWHLHSEKPCRMVYRPESPTPEGMTVADGVQIWTNPQLTG